MDRIPVIDGPALLQRGNQKGIPTVVGVISVDLLIKYHKVDRYEFYKKDGYQRMINSDQVEELADSLLDKEVDIPTAILLSLRDVEYQDAVESDGAGQVLVLNGPEVHTLYVVDGQHRTEAVKQAVGRAEGQQKSELLGIELPFVCIIGANCEQESKQFFVVNSKAKSVKLDLALALNTAMKRGDRRQNKAGDLIIKMARESEIWRDRINLPNKKGKKKNCSYRAMFESLCALLNRSDSLERCKEEELYMIIEAYWKGIKKVLPEPFTSPAGYNLQRTTGVKVMHMLLPTVQGSVKDRCSASSYEEVLKPLLRKLSGKNANGDQVSGASFWLSGRGGASSNYSSEGKPQKLADKISDPLMND